MINIDSVKDLKYMHDLIKLKCPPLTLKEYFKKYLSETNFEFVKLLFDTYIDFEKDTERCLEEKDENGKYVNNIMMLNIEKKNIMFPEDEIDADKIRFMIDAVLFLVYKETISIKDALLFLGYKFSLLEKIKEQISIVDGERYVNTALTDILTSSNGVINLEFGTASDSKELTEAISILIKAGILDAEYLESEQLVDILELLGYVTSTDDGTDPDMPIFYDLFIKYNEIKQRYTFEVLVLLVAFETGLYKSKTDGLLPIIYKNKKLLDLIPFCYTGGERYIDYSNDTIILSEIKRIIKLFSGNAINDEIAEAYESSFRINDYDDIRESVLYKNVGYWSAIYNFVDIDKLNFNNISFLLEETLLNSVLTEESFTKAVSFYNINQSESEPKNNPSSFLNNLEILSKQTINYNGK